MVEEHHSETHHPEHHEHPAHQELSKPAAKRKLDWWKIITVILIAALAVAIFTEGFRQWSFTSKDEIATETVDYINKNLLQGQSTAEMKSITEENGGYNLKLSINGNELEAYVTKDGSLLFPKMYAVSLKEEPLLSTTASQPKEVPKADKAKAELYIFSYCPAGTVALDSFAQAGKLLYKVADLKVKFFSNMHGLHEKQQNQIQECIQEAAKDKYWDYALQYVQKIYQVCGPTGSIDCDKNESIKLMKAVGISSESVMSCVASKGDALYTADQNDAGTLQLQYSPSIVINGLYLGNADRSPEGIKTAICSAFNQAPAECSQVLGSAAAKSTGSCS